MCSGQQSTIKAQLDAIQDECGKLATESCQEMGNLRSTLAEIIDELKYEHGHRFRHEDPVLEEEKISVLERNLRNSLLALTSKICSLPKETAVLQRLSFEAMFRREDAVIGPEHGTFKWILDGVHYFNSLKHGYHDNHTADSENLRQDGNETTILKGTASKGVRTDSSDWNPQNGESQSGPEHSELFTGACGSKARAGAMELHVVLYRSGPSISKIHGNGQSHALPHRTAGGWLPHLEHIMVISERARRRQISESFASFLREGNGVYFCCGKAGSGKSTFMKYICRHEEVLDQLRVWSGLKKLVFINMFFWNSGDDLQMSMEGFYRSLLFQVVLQCPESLQVIFPGVFHGEVNQDDGIRRLLLPFRFSELQDAVHKLLETTQFPNHRFCFFIDGLDEFKGESVEHFRFAQSLKQWATNDVKIICSARPHTEFVDTFTDQRRIIQLHEWTKDDIYRYATAELYNGLGSGEISTAFYTSLANFVAQKADGVFIWARLVVRSILEGIAHGDSTKALFDRVDQAPRDLNLLYEKILSSINSTIRRRAEEALLLVVRCPFEVLNALTFTWLEDLEDKDFPLNRPYCIYSGAEIQRRQELAKRQVALLTRGLVEMRPLLHSIRGLEVPVFAQRLDYHHLTAREFLTARAPQFAKDTTSAELRDRYARLVLAEMKFSGMPLLLLYNFRKVCEENSYTFHLIPDRYLDELAAYYPARFTTLELMTSHIGRYDRQSNGDYAQNQTLTVSCWFGFLMSLSYAFQYYYLKQDSNLDMDPWTWKSLWAARDQHIWFEMMCRTLELLLRYGVDQDVVLLLIDTGIDPAPDLQAQINIMDECVLEEGDIFYMELSTMLEVIQPSNLTSLRNLLGAFPGGDLRAAACGSLSQIRAYFRGNVNKLPAREMYKPVNAEHLQSQRLSIYGITSKDETLKGPLTILVY